MNTPIQLSSRLALLAPGLYLVRLRNPSAFPTGFKIGLYPSPVGEGVIRFMQGGPVQPVAFLQRSTDRVIVHVLRDNATLLIVDYKRQDCVLSEPVEVAIERQDVDRIASATLLSAGKARKTIENQSVGVMKGFLPVQGAMANGRQFVAANGLVGSPAATEEIAAFQVDAAGLPPGVNLAYACKKNGNADPAVAVAGKMVGLDKPSFPITAVCFLADPTQGSDYELKGHVVFAGSPPSAIVSGIELSGPTGCEALVALRVAFVKRTDQRGAPPSTSVWNDPAVLKRKAPGPHKGSKALKE